MKRLFIYIGLGLWCLFTAVAAPAAADQNASGRSSDYEIVYWESVKDSDNIEMYRAYIKRYPNGIFTDLAQIKIKALEQVSPAAEARDSKPIAPVTRVQLRSVPKKINEDDVLSAVRKYNFCDLKRNRYGEFNNAFIDNHDGTVTDKATGLIWERSGSSLKLERRKADLYINTLNKDKFAGRSDWRLPTVEELASLIQHQRSQSGWLYIDSLFDTPGGTFMESCWSADDADPIFGNSFGGWVVSFYHGSVLRASWRADGYNSGNSDAVNEANFVRAVCAARSSDNQ